LVREAFRLSKTQLPPGLDLVVVPRAQNPTFAEVQRALADLTLKVARRFKLSPP
jgi:ribonuclease P protein component